MNLGRLLTFGALFVGSVAISNATLLFDQAPDTGVYEGSWVNQTGGQNFADEVELSQSGIVTDYDYFTNFDPSNFGPTMTVKLLADNGGTPGAYLSTESVSTANYSFYGTYQSEAIYEVDLTLTTPWALAANTLYWAGASGDGFEAGQVSLSGDLNPLADGKMAQFAGSTYGFQPSIGDQAFALEGTPTPEPASMAALGIGICGLVARRRRK